MIWSDRKAPHWGAQSISAKRKSLDGIRLRLPSVVRVPHLALIWQELRKYVADNSLVAGWLILENQISGGAFVLKSITGIEHLAGCNRHHHWMLSVSLCC